MTTSDAHTATATAALPAGAPPAAASHGTAVEPITTSGLTHAMDFSSDEVDIITRTFCRGASPDELSLFLRTCQQTGLSPFHRQIFAVKRFDRKEKREVMSIQVSIDGFRLIAQRSGMYAGQVGPWWCDEDGQWVDVWLKRTPPRAAKVGVLHRGFDQPLFTVALWDEYVQTYKPSGSQTAQPTAMWENMPALMLAKCAESLALRKAFPAELSGLYSTDEMGQAGGTWTIVTPETLTEWQTLAEEIRDDELLRSAIDVNDLEAKMMAKEAERSQGQVTQLAQLPEGQVRKAIERVQERVQAALAGAATSPPPAPDAQPAADVHDAQVVDDQDDPERPFTD